MSYRIDHRQPIADEVRRIAHEQVDSALDQLETLGRGDSVTIIRECRKHTKKVRGLVRLVRPALGDHYKAANTTFRDAARELSGYRDDHALLHTFDAVMATSNEHLAPGGHVAVREALVEHAAASTKAVNEESEHVVRARDLLHDGRLQIDDWNLDAEGWAAMSAGLMQTYGRGVDALEASVERPTPPRHHELRKRAKYTWYHVRLLGDSAPSTLKPLARQFHRLSGGLGDAHDLAVLRERLTSAPDTYGGDETVEQTVLVLDGRRSLLTERSIALASRLYAEKPKHFARRLGAYWNAWDTFDDEQPVGTLTNLFDTNDQLDDLTVRELRNLASDVELPGRSTRRRDELVAGLRASNINAS